MICRNCLDEIDRVPEACPERDDPGGPCEPITLADVGEAIARARRRGVAAVARLVGRTIDPAGDDIDAAAGRLGALLGDIANGEDPDDIGDRHTAPEVIADGY